MTVSENYLLSIGGFLGLTIVILTTALLHNIEEGIDLDSNPIFTQRFPVWRGASYLLFYIWVLGLCVLFYESSQINYKLIFHF